MAEDAVGSPEGAATAAPSESPTESGSGLDLINLTKDFPGGTIAVDDVNLHVDHGEYVVLLGPSGCGKTTTLRMIGGHEVPSGGDIVLDGQSLVSLPPHKRPTTTVFQHFALFPHRSVLDNVAFGLKMEKVPKDERRATAMEALDMVGLTPLAGRKPAALSGGQQHRVLVQDEHDVRVSVKVDGPAPEVGQRALVAIRAAAVEVLDDASATSANGNTAECEIVFVEFLGDLVKLHLTAGGERMLAKVPGERYPALRGKEGEKIRISWKEEDAQLLQS